MANDVTRDFERKAANAAKKNPEKYGTLGTELDQLNLTRDALGQSRTNLGTAYEDAVDQLGGDVFATGEYNKQRSREAGQTSKLSTGQAQGATDKAASNTLLKTFDQAQTELANLDYQEQNLDKQYNNIFVSQTGQQLFADTIGDIISLGRDVNAEGQDFREIELGGKNYYLEDLGKGGGLDFFSEGGLISQLTGMGTEVFSNFMDQWYQSTETGTLSGTPINPIFSLVSGSPVLGTNILKTGQDLNTQQLETLISNYTGGSFSTAQEQQDFTDAILSDPASLTSATSARERGETNPIVTGMQLASLAMLAVPGLRSARLGAGAAKKGKKGASAAGAAGATPDVDPVQNLLGSQLGSDVIDTSPSAGGGLIQPGVEDLLASPTPSPSPSADTGGSFLDQLTGGTRGALRGETGKGSPFRKGEKGTAKGLAGSPLAALRTTGATGLGLLTTMQNSASVEAALQRVGAGEESVNLNDEFNASQRSDIVSLLGGDTAGAQPQAQQEQQSVSSMIASLLLGDQQNEQNNSSSIDLLSELLRG